LCLEKAVQASLGVKCNVKEKKKYGGVEGVKAEGRKQEENLIVDINLKVKGRVLTSEGRSRGQRKKGGKGSRRRKGPGIDEDVPPLEGGGKI